MDTNTEILTPIWVLKEKIDKDYEEWVMFNKPSLVVLDQEYSDELEEEEAERPPFPEYDSTKAVLEILERYNLHFNPITGAWSE